MLFKYTRVYNEAYIVPFNRNLKSILENKSVRNDIDNPMPNLLGCYRTVLDVQRYREKIASYQNDKLLAVVLYKDEIGLTQPIGSRSKTQKMMMIYYTLANIHLRNRSTLSSIFLYGIVKSAYLKKKRALENVFWLMIHDVKKLQTHGVDVVVEHGLIKNFKGIVLFGSGDTPASNLLGGFKESVSANRLCRTCTTTQDQWKNFHTNEDFHVRNIADHVNELDVVTDPTISKGDRASLGPC